MISLSLYPINYLKFFLPKWTLLDIIIISISTLYMSIGYLEFWFLRFSIWISQNVKMSLFVLYTIHNKKKRNFYEYIFWHCDGFFRIVLVFIYFLLTYLFSFFFLFCLFVLSKNFCKCFCAYSCSFFSYLHNTLFLLLYQFLAYSFILSLLFIFHRACFYKT